MAEKTYLELLMDETLRPVRAALEMFRQEITETMQIPDAPWKILNKAYDELTEQEIIALFDIYHMVDEEKPCPMCSWVTRMELTKARQEKEAGL